MSGLEWNPISRVSSTAAPGTVPPSLSPDMTSTVAARIVAFTAPSPGHSAIPHPVAQRGKLSPPRKAEVSKAKSQGRTTLSKQRASPTSKLSCRERINHVAPARVLSSLNVATPRGTLRIKISPTAPARLPQEARHLLEQNLERVYSQSFDPPVPSPEEVQQALQTFEQAGCSWEKMKAQPLEKMRVINCLRRVVLETIKAELVHKFPGLQIEDFGSNNVTSDRDIALKMSAGQQDQEALALLYFHERFEALWGQSSGKVFDTNVYTGYHLEKFYTSDQTAATVNLQGKMSLVMFYRNTCSGGDRSAWNTFCSGALSSAPDPSARERLRSELEAVENYSRDLDALLDKRIIDLYLEDQRTTPTEDIRWLTKGDASDIWLNAGRLKKANPDLALRAMNALHAEARASGEQLFRHRSAVISCLDVTQPEQFMERYQAAAAAIIANKAARIAELEKAPIGSNTPALTREQMRREMEALKAEIIQMRNAQASVSEQAEQPWIDEFCQSKQMVGLAKLFIEPLQREADRMLLEAQKLNTKGRCSAHEAHISEGAYAFVVQDLQVQRNQPRGMASYMQAIHELMGFYHSHQRGHVEPHAKMIEVSKYVAPRLMVAIDRMQERATALGLPFPDLGDSEKLRGYFGELFPLRGKGLTAQQAAAHEREAREKYNIDPQAVNAQLTRMQVVLNAWTTSLTADQQTRLQPEEL